MTLMPLERKPDVPLTIITADDVRASVNRARKSLEDAAEEIIWQIKVEGWKTLGYRSWTEMREKEYRGAAFMVPSKSRPEIVSRLKEIEVGRTVRGKPKHLTDREIANTVGVSKPQVTRDLSKNKMDHMSQNVDPADDVIDAEVVEEPTNTFQCWSCEKSFPTDTATETDDGPICNNCLDVYDHIDAEVVEEPSPTIHTCPTCGGTGTITS